MSHFRIYIPTRTLFGAGMVKELHNQQLPGKKAMIVISNGRSTKDNGYLNTVESELQQAGVETAVFDQVEANPLKSTVMAGAAFAKENNCDFLVALGGGSVMDASKAMAFMATNPGDVWDYISGGTGKGQTMVNKPLPLVCITTTAGTGSEADQWGVITNDETNEKIGFGGYDELFPVLSIVDPELMKSVPPKFTAYQGFDDSSSRQNRFALACLGFSHRACAGLFGVFIIGHLLVMRLKAGSRNYNIIIAVYDLHFNFIFILKIPGKRNRVILEGGRRRI